MKNQYINNLKTIFAIKEVSLSSTKSYLSVLVTLRDNLKYKGKSLKFLNDIEGVKKSLEEKSESYKILTYSAIIKSLNKPLLKKEYQITLQEINKKRNERMETNVMTDKEKKKLKGLKFDDLLKILPILEKSSQRDYIIIYLYLMCDFTPRLDYASMKIIKNEEELLEDVNQVLILEDCIKFYFNKFKNVKKLGKQNFECCKGVEDVLRKYVKEECGDCKNLFCYLGDKCLTNRRLSVIIKKSFKKYLSLDIGVNEIRKLKEMRLQKSEKYLNMSLKDKRLEHKKFFHSKLTAETNYNKIIE